VHLGCEDSTRGYSGFTVAVSRSPECKVALSSPGSPWIGLHPRGGKKEPPSFKSERPHEL
jgi:hypothetical protein